jgi:NADH:ubiquinone oxidoreductase subunit 6 (subunit J)
LSPEIPYLFYFLATGAVVTGALVVLAKNLVHAAFWTMPCFLSVACLFLLLGNGLLFTVQLLIYAGAIPITVLFVLMLTREVMSEKRDEQGKLWPLAVATALSFLLLMVVHLRSVENPSQFKPFPQAAVAGRDYAEFDLTKETGFGFLGDYLLPFELSSLLLLGSMVGAVYLARADRKVRATLPENAVKKEESDAGNSAATLADRRDAAV